MLLLVRRGDYDGCRAASPVRRLAGGADTKFTLDRPGLFYFISDVPARCEAGQRMVVRAADARDDALGAPTPAPAPAREPAPGGTDDEPSGTPPSGDRPIPAPFKLFVAAFLGFISGCFLAGFIVWLCMNCRRLVAAS